MFGLFRLFGSASTKMRNTNTARTGQRPRHVRLGVEGLEERNLLTVTIRSGVLIVEGTAGADDLRVYQQAGTYYVYELNPGGTWRRTDVPAASVSSGYLGMLGYGGNDTIVNSTSLNMYAWGGPGHDRIWGGSGADVIRGEDGDDQIYAGWANDWIDGGNGNDRIFGGLGNDTVYGWYGNDQLQGDDANNAGSGGNDSLIGGPGNDFLWGGPANDRLYGDDGTDQLAGGPGNDLLFGGAGFDKLYGENGDDYLDGGGNGDYLHGGFGRDRFKNYRSQWLIDFNRFEDRMV